MPNWDRYLHSPLTHSLMLMCCCTHFNLVDYNSLNCMPSNRDSVPSKHASTLLESDNMPLERDGTCLEGNSTPSESNNVPLKRDSAPLERDGAPSKRDNVPLERDSLPLEWDSGPSKSDNTPLKSYSAPLKHHQKGTAWHQKEIACLNMLIKRPMTYLLMHQRFLCGVILQWFTKDTRPEPLDKFQIIQAHLPLGIILGHAKSGLVWK